MAQPYETPVVAEDAKITQVTGISQPSGDPN
jgi:hypothetical protein